VTQQDAPQRDRGAAASNTAASNTAASNTAASNTAASNAPMSGQAETASPQQRSFWGSASTELDDWIAIEPDGTVVAYSGKVETGTGVRTALAQIVAEELDVPLERVRLVMGDTERAPDEGYTSGSMTVRLGGGQLRKAAAAARLALLERSAERLGVPREELEAHDGMVSVRGTPDRSVRYGELQGGQPFARQITEQALLKRAQEYRVVGTDVRRIDLVGKFTGAPSFVHDLRLPGMLHGRVVRARRPGARVLAVDERAVRDAQVIRLGNFIGVVAEREEQAIRAAAQLQVTWEETADRPPTERLYDWMRAQPTTDHVIAESGDAERALQAAAKRVRAVYEQPFQAHASIGPSCAVAEWQDGKLTVWASSGGVYPLRGALADLLQLPPEYIRVIHLEGAGAYGQNGSEDVAADAALLAREMGRAVRVQWSRRDEFIGEPKAAPMVMELSAGLDDDGHIVGWRFDVWSPSHSNRPRTALGLLAGREVREVGHGRAGHEQMSAPAAFFFMGGARNARTNYALPDQRILMHGIADPPLRTSSMRSLGGAGNTFANESFLDELAVAAEADPLAFRLRHLDDPRGCAVLEAAAQASGWGEALPASEGRGLAFACYENDQAYVAMVAHVGVDEATGVVRVRRMVVAHDCGLIVNPDGVRNQVEGNVIQALSRVLKEEVRFDAGGQTTVDWEGYPILTFLEVPEVEIALINRPDEPPVGAGEPATVTVAAAVANAVYAATGARLRQVPFTPERVRAALAVR
jgi:nicotinate dehydrogenase subunit B